MYHAQFYQANQHVTKQSEFSTVIWLWREKCIGCVLNSFFFTKQGCLTIPCTGKIPSCLRRNDATQLEGKKSSSTRVSQYHYIAAPFLIVYSLVVVSRTHNKSKLPLSVFLQPPLVNNEQFDKISSKISCFSRFYCICLFLVG